MLKELILLEININELYMTIDLALKLDLGYF